MPTFTLFYILPAGVFIAMAVLWYLGGRLPRLFSVLPVLSCYAATAALLFCGGMCHRVGHVRLSGLEMDLVERGGKERSIPLGGTSTEGRAEAGIEIPGVPPDALRISLEGEELKIRPGPGYQRGILVRSDGKLVPLEEGGVPRLVPLVNGDQITVPATEGGEVIAQWRLGKQRMELDVTATPRWIGATGTGIARVPGLAPQVLGLRLDKGDLVLIKGPEWAETLGVQVNGRRVAFGAPELRQPYRPSLTTVALVKQEPLAGTFTFTESSPPLRTSAAVTWKSLLEQPVAYPFEMETGRAYRVGGSLEDHVFVKGLPAGVMSLNVSADGRLTLDMTKDGLEAQKENRLTGTYPQTAETGKALMVGNTETPYAGAFHLLGPVQEPAAPPPATTPTPASPTEDAPEGDIDSPSATAVPVTRWRCAWQPMIETRWNLPNRTISLPLASVPVDLFTRRVWTQLVFPLGQISAREGSLRSVIAYTPNHPAWVNGASLLQLDPALRITRSGAAVAGENTEIGLLKKGATLEILQVLAETQGDRVASSLGNALHPATVHDAQRVTVRRRFAKVRVEMESRGKSEVPVLRVEFEKPMIRSVSMSEVKEELAARDEEGLQGVRFGLNDRSGFSDLPHQVSFPLLTQSFDEANADVEMKWGSFSVQDDFKHQTLEYGDEFEIGGANRLLLSITKETIPPGRIFWVVLAGLIATVVAWKNGGSFWWMALQFGVAFLSCSRVLFGQVALVNPPFNREIVDTAMKTLVATPVLLGLGMYFARELLPGRIEARVRAIESRLTYFWLCVFAVGLVLLRILILGGFGAKEAFSLGGMRVALSVFFVPVYLLLFAQACLLLWRDKEASGGLRTPVVTRFTLATLCLFACQAVTALLVSDLGMFLYFVPMALVLAVVGVSAFWEGVVRSLRVTKDELKAQKPWLASVGGLGLILPILMMALVFTAPKSLLNAWPGMAGELSSDEELVTDSTLLRVLQFAQEDYLINLGTDTAERIAQDHAIMANYAHRGLFGEGYLQVDILPAKAVTALNDNVSAIFIFAQFGVVGALAVMLAYLAVLLSALGARERVNSLTSWLALMAGMSFALVSLYMMAANYGLLPFTGRNMYLLGLNSWSDVAESFALIFLIILGIARSDFRTTAFEKTSSTVLTDVIDGNEP
ncbi:MAG TPA: hypothetical protein VGE39_17725 [Prosthecobacter sp.]